MPYGEKMFAEDLAGHSLMSNRSLWVSFVTLSNQTWHDGNLVLLGDAAHTAHFTIGSGTKLAMEDAIALVDGLERRRGNLEAALVDYELDRRPAAGNRTSYARANLWRPRGPGPGWSSPSWWPSHPKAASHRGRPGCTRRSMPKRGGGSSTGSMRNRKRGSSPSSAMPGREARPGHGGAAGSDPTPATRGRRPPRPLAGATCCPPP